MVQLTKRARNRKRWTEAKGSLQPTVSPLLGSVLALDLDAVGLSLKRNLVGIGVIAVVARIFGSLITLRHASS